jgi:hypothetical protein
MTTDELIPRHHPNARHRPNVAVTAVTERTWRAFPKIGVKSRDVIAGRS